MELKKESIIFIIILLSALLFQFCKQREEVSDILFEVPQPENIKNLSAFPKTYQGTYIDEDSSILMIGNNCLVNQYYYDMQIHKNELDSISNEVIFKDGKIVYVKLKKAFDAKTIKDTIYWKETIIDTFFKISQDKVIRKFKGYLVLNEKIDSAAYDVHILKLEKRKLTYTQVNSKLDLANLKPVSEIIFRDSIKNDTIFHFHPNKKEFKDFLENNSFSTQKIRYKIK